MVFLKLSYELWGNRLPTFKSFLKNYNRFAKTVSFSFLETFKSISLPAGFQFNHDPVEITIRVSFWFSFGFLMNCKGIACELSQHSSIISSTLPKRFPSANFQSIPKIISIALLKRVPVVSLFCFYWMSLPAGFQLHHDLVEISISFLVFCFGVRMNCAGIACQYSKHS